MRTPLISLALLFVIIGCKKEPAAVVAPAPSSAGRSIVMSVTEKGFEPSKITVAKGEPVKLVVTRTTEATCATELLIEGTDINVPLPLNTPTTIDFTPPKSGEIHYGCAMGMMVSGILLVE